MILLIIGQKKYNWVAVSLAAHYNRTKCPELELMKHF